MCLSNVERWGSRAPVVALVLADWGSGALVLAPLPWTPFPPALLSPRPASPAQGASAGPEQDMARTFRGHGQDMLRTGGGHGRDPFPVTNWLGGQSRKWAPCSLFCGSSCARPRRLGPCAAIWQRWRAVPRFLLCSAAPRAAAPSVPIGTPRPPAPRGDSTRRPRPERAAQFPQRRQSRRPLHASTGARPWPPAAVCGCGVPPAQRKTRTNQDKRGRIRTWDTDTRTSVSVSPFPARAQHRPRASGAPLPRNSPC